MHHRGAVLTGWVPAAALAVFGLIVPAARAATITTVATIPGAGDGATPVAGLTEFAGAFYGTTSGGGGTQGLNPGTVFRIDLMSGVETIVHAFTGAADGGSPQAALTVLDGRLYGTTVLGGANGGGVVFSIDPATGAETVVASLPAWTVSRSTLVAYNGLLYGTGNYCGDSGEDYGCIFSVDPVSSIFAKVYAFPMSGHDGFTPGNLVRHGDYLFGTATAGGRYSLGTLFRFDPRTNGVRLEHAFGAAGDGAYPATTLTELGGLLYGTTQQGGSSTAGTIFAMDVLHHQETVVHSFAGTDGSTPSNGLLKQDGVLYGATLGGGAGGNGVVFAFDPAAGQVTTLHDFTGTEFGYPVANFVAEGGALYGAQQSGGPAGDGQVFAVDIATGQFSTLHYFGGQEFSTSTSALTKSASGLYGVSLGGGPTALGSIFKIFPGTGVAETAHAFQGSDGARPGGGLLDVAGLLYGSTFDGGINGLGTVFSFDPAHRKLTTLHAFAGPDGQYPGTSLVLVDGRVYGTTSAGGGSALGVVYRLDLATLRETTVASFTATTGYPGSPLTLLQGVLYGVAHSGGAHGYGTIFKLGTTGHLTALYSFVGGDDGGYPEPALCAFGGILYGSTASGRRLPATLFKFDPSTNTKTTLRSLHDDTSMPSALVVKGARLFGTVRYGYDPHAAYGAVIRLDPASGRTTIFPFAAGASTSPDAPLLLLDGALFGTTPSNTNANAGTVFKFVP